MNIFVGLIAFMSEYLDSALGMGYGTALTPILILMGHDPHTVVPAVLISQLVTDLAACFFHHKVKNVDFSPGSVDFKLALLLGITSCIGVIASVFVAFHISKTVLGLYIGTLVVVIGIVVFLTAARPMLLSWKKLTVVGIIASFNKGLSGGGYGPLIMGGQLISGVDPKRAIGITALSEAFTCLVGFLLYFFGGKAIDWKLTGTLVLWAILAVPLATITVKHTVSPRLKRYVAFLMMFLGGFMIFRIVGG